MKKSWTNLIFKIRCCLLSRVNNFIERLSGNEIFQVYLGCAGDSGLFRTGGRGAGSPQGRGREERGGCGGEASGGVSQCFERMQLGKGRSPGELVP